MAEGKAWESWNHTASIQATLANTVRDPKQQKKPFTDRNFHPYFLRAEKERREREGIPDPSEVKFDVSILKSVFVDDEPFEKIVQDHGL